MYSHTKGILYTLLSGLLFGLIGYFGVNVIHNDISVYTMLFWRFTICAIFMGFLLLMQAKKPEIKKSRELFKVILYGVFFYGSGSILYFHAANYIGSGLAMVIFFTYPVFIIMINKFFFQIHFNKIYGLSLAVILGGMVCLIQGGGFVFNATGILIGVFSALLYAFYILASKNSTVDPLLSTFTLSLGCMITCGLTSIIDQSFVIPVSLKDWGNILGIGIICTALPILLLLKGLKYLSSTQASLLSVLEPVFVVLFGILLLNEEVSWMQMMGVCIILAGSLLSLLKEQDLNTTDTSTSAV